MLNEDNVQVLEDDLIKEFISLRHELGLSQQKMANECGAVREMVAALENKRKHPQVITILKFLEPFGYTLKIAKLEEDTSKRKYL